MVQLDWSCNDDSPGGPGLDTRLTEEQELVRETAEQLARDLAPESPEALAERDAWRAGWEQLAATGLLGMRLPERAGGSPTSAVEVSLVAEELGRFGVPLPFLGSAVLASELLTAAEADRELLARLAEGSLRLAPVLDPKLRRWARPGEAGIAWDAQGADAGLCLDESTGTLQTVELGEALASQDLTRVLYEVRADAQAVELGGLGQEIGPEGRTRALALALAAISADLVGVMQGALDRAVEHIRSREQFGVKLGSFQALQHISAEALVSVEGARGCSWYGAWAVEALDPEEALLAARSAKAYASEHAREICESSIQLHGGIGMTWESFCHVALRRALLGRETLGDEHAQLHEVALARTGPFAPA